MGRINQCHDLISPVFAVFSLSHPAGNEHDAVGRIQANQLFHQVRYMGRTNGNDEQIQFFLYRPEIGQAWASP